MFARFISHEHCYLWNTNLIGLHSILNLSIALSCSSILIVLFYFVQQREALPHASVLVLFGMFVVSYGTVHFLEIWALWQPIYWLVGIFKVITAIVSIYVATIMFEIFPQVLNLLDRSDLIEANNKLEREIEQRKQIETNLEQEQAFVRAMLDNLSEGIVACNSRGELNLFNQAAQNFYELPHRAISAISADEWSQKYDLFMPDGKTLLPKDNIPLFRALKGESVKDVEIAIVLEPNQPRILLASANPIINSQGQKLGAVAVMEDITETKQAQRALQKSESIIKSFCDSAPMMMGVVESIERDDFYHVFDNNTTAAFFGLTSQSMRGMRTSELGISIEDRHRLNNACLQSLNTKQPVQFESTYRLGSNTKHLSLTVATISETSTAGHPLFSYIVRDISDRKKMETVLQESEERFRLAFEDVATGIAIVALDGLFLQVNRSLCKIIGFTKKELTKLTFQTITHAEDLDLDLENVSQLLAGEISNYQMYKRYIHKQGHIVWVLISVSLVRDLAKQPQYFIAQIQDMTEQKTSQVKLARSLKEKEVMLQEIHHRVKNNLQVICSLLNLQSRYLNSAKTLKAFKETQNRVKSMALVHEQLYQSNNLSEIVLSDYIKQLTDNLLRTYSVASEIKCRLKIADFSLDLDTAVPCGLIINEIMTNAIKYAFALEQGEIAIEAYRNEENSLVLSIADNGIGLKPDYDIETSKSLGLRLVKNLTEQLQGQYEIITKQNCGTKFEFTFNRIKQY